MMNKVVHCKREPYDVYIGRPSIFGNPFSHKEGTQAGIIVATREEAVEKYRQWVNGEIQVDGLTPPTMDQIKELQGKTLGCWCAPQSCHGDVLAELAAEESNENFRSN